MRHTFSAIALSLFLTVAATAEPFTTVGAGLRQTVETYDFSTNFPGASTGTITVEYNEAYVQRHDDGYFAEVRGFSAPEQKHYRFVDNTAATEYYADVEGAGWQVSAGPKFALPGFDAVRIMPVITYQWAEYTETTYVTNITQTVTKQTYATDALSFDIALMTRFAKGGYLSAGLEVVTDMAQPKRDTHNVWVDVTATAAFITLTGRATYQLSPPPGYDRVMSFEGGIGVGF